MDDILSFTFEAQMFPDSEWQTSIGRWNTIEDSARAAVEWLSICALNHNFGGVRLKQVTEWAIEPAPEPK